MAPPPLKCVVLDEDDNVLYRSYARHGSQIPAQVASLLRKIGDHTAGHEVLLAISGSAGMGIAERCDVPFLQEVYATRLALQKYLPQTDVAIELGGEDAKILFLSGGLEVRMNGSCAGGTGAFIDQMATLLGMTPAELGEAAKRATQQYTIASRCGVFAKSDIQPLLNQGARREDIAKSILCAVVSQTIGGLAQGRPIKGNVVYLGGPLHFLSELRKSFDEALSLHGSSPENALYYVALGAAQAADTPCSLSDLVPRVLRYQETTDYYAAEPLFHNEAEYEMFLARHQGHTVAKGDPASYHGRAFLGIDAGSTTLKTALIGEQGQLLHSSYQQSSGNPVPLVREYLEKLYASFPNLDLVGGASTGYGEDLIKNAFALSHGVVETVAHAVAAQQFLPEVEFIIDIGGQDMKCLKIKNGAIDNIFLNEACSSGCGSFLQSFASALGYDIASFARLGLFAERPVDLGSRCTVFMNSSVKQAQKDGATIENISAGLSQSVVKNALYKVIRVTDRSALGKHIVVQGGTFLNDAVLRAFEQELGVEVIRPDIAGLMGAYGAALWAMRRGAKGIVSPEELREFTHTVQDIRCGLCQNHCHLTRNTFPGGRSFLSGNRCERPLTSKTYTAQFDLYEKKLHLLRPELFKESVSDEEKPPVVSKKRGRIGIPMGLNLYELLPFWRAFFGALGFESVVSPLSSHELYRKGESSLPSDTVCFPAKLMHGHIESLLEMGVDTIFYPCLTYNLQEHLGDRQFNCPVVAYYPEVIGANLPGIRNVRYLSWYLGIHRRRDFPRKITPLLQREWNDITLHEVRRATDAAFDAYHHHMAQIAAAGEEIIAQARKAGKQIILLAGRPYHVDPEINHGINRLIAGLGAAVITEDSLIPRLHKPPTDVLNQWTYHARLYAAAEYIADIPDIHLVQLVSFGCGLDAITGDEVRRILESHDKLYTQIKIDEITNLGAVKIRLRSLLSAVEAQHMPQIDA